MRFEKWQALGNDYVILEQERLPWDLTPSRGAAHLRPPLRGRLRRGAAALAQRGPGVRRRAADLQPRRLRGRALRQRRPRGDPLPAAPRLDRRRDLLDPHRRGADHADDHLGAHLLGGDGPRLDAVEGLSRAGRPTAAGRWSPAAAPGTSSTSRSATRSARSSSGTGSRSSTWRRSGPTSKATSSSPTGPTSPSCASTAAGCGRGSSSAGWGRRSPRAPAPAARR